MAVSATTVESEVAYFLGYGYASNAGGSTGAFLDNIAQRAMKNFLIPTVMRNKKGVMESSAHKWSWLSDSGVVVLNDPETFSHAASTLFDNDPTSEDAPSVTNGVVTLGLTTPTNFPQWVHTHTGGNGSGGADQVTAMVKISGLGAADGYHIPTSVNATGSSGFSVTLADTSINVAETGTGVSFTFYHVMHAAGTSFGAIDGFMTHQVNTGHNHVEVINLGALRDLYAGEPVLSDTPQYVAYDEAKSRFLFFPLPDTNYTLRYKYQKEPATTTIPDKYEGIVINGALALAENYSDSPNSGRFNAIYQNQLMAAIQEDRAQHRTEYFGVNTDRSDRIMPYGHKTDRSSIYYTNRSGTTFPS